MISKNTIKYIRSLELKKNRTKEHVFVAEGPKVVGDLCAAGFIPRLTVGTQDWFDASGVLPADSGFVVSDEELRRVSFLQHPQQVLALFNIPNYEADGSACTDNLCLALDGVQDPGNLGTIIRIADWFGIETVFCGMGTVDAYSPKVVQATMGSIARVKIVNTSLPDFIDRLPVETPVYATSLDGADIYSSPLTSNGLVVMGNEGNGVSREVLNRAGHRLFIPCYSKTGAVDSLNVAVATAVTCAEFRRRIGVLK